MPGFFSVEPPCLEQCMTHGRFSISIRWESCEREEKGGRGSRREARLASVAEEDIRKDREEITLRDQTR